MARPRKPERDQAKILWLESDKTRLLKDIAVEIGVSESQIRKWKNLDQWDKVTLPNTKGNVPKRNDGRTGNNNATGPPRNQHAKKHGLFSKWLPDEVQEIVGELKSANPIDILWDNIQLQYAAILRAQKIMWVQDKDDMTKEVRKEKRKIKDRNTERTKTKEEEVELEYEIQFAWDKQNRYMAAQSRAMAELRSMIKQYDEMLHKNMGLASEEQRARIDQIKAQTKKLETENKNDMPTESVVIHDDIPESS